MMSVSNDFEVPAALAFIAHGFSSISLILLNKSIALEFPYVWTMLLIQNLASMFLSALVFAARISPLRIPNSEILPRIALNTVVLLAVLWCSIEALRHASVPLYVLARNAVPFGTALLDSLFMGREITRRALLSMVITLIGTIIYTTGDNDTQYRGFVIVFINSALVSGMCVYESALMGRAKDLFTPVEMNFFRTSMSTPFVLALWNENPSYEELRQSAAMLIFSGFIAFSIGTLLYYLQSIVSATTIQMANITYKFATVVVSRVTHPAEISWMGWLGYGICTLGVIDYAFAPKKASGVTDGSAVKRWWFPLTWKKEH